MYYFKLTQKWKNDAYIGYVVTGNESLEMHEVIIMGNGIFQPALPPEVDPLQRSSPSPHFQ